MKRIRIGKDISMRWEITTDGVAIPLEGRDLTVEIKSPIGIVSNIPYRVDGNSIIMTYYGAEQKRVGEYSITLWENKGKPGQNVVDVIRAFELVRTSPEENDFVGGDLQVESVDLGTENFDILTEGGYRAINIDTLQAEALEDSVNINGKTYSNESFTITLPKANLDSAGVMSASDVRTLKEHADSIAQIKTSCEKNASDISVISDELGTLNSQVDANTADIASLNTEVSDLQSKVDENTTSISHINTELDNKNDEIAQINTTLEEHTDSIAQIKTSCEKNASDISVISDELGTLNSQVDANTADIASLNTEVSAMQSKVDENTTSISQINTTLEEHTESINSKITTDRIENCAVTSEKIATTAFDSTLSVSGKIAPSDVVGKKLTDLEGELYGEVKKLGVRINSGGSITFDTISIEKEGDAIEFTVYRETPVMPTVNAFCFSAYNNARAIGASSALLCINNADGNWLPGFNGSYNEYAFHDSLKQSHYKIIWEGSNISLYRNGIFITSAPASVIKIDRIGNLTRGEYWTGLITDFFYTTNNFKTSLFDLSGFSTNDNVEIIKETSGGKIKEHDETLENHGERLTILEEEISHTANVTEEVVSVEDIYDGLSPKLIFAPNKKIVSSGFDDSDIYDSFYFILPNDGKLYVPRIGDTKWMRIAIFGGSLTSHTDYLYKDSTASDFPNTVDKALEGKEGQYVVISLNKGVKNFNLTYNYARAEKTLDESIYIPAIKNNKVFGKSPIIIKVTNSTSFDVYVLNTNTGKYLTYTFKKHNYNVTIDGKSYIGGDIWYNVAILDKAGNSIAQGNLNFIFSIDGSVSGFEKEGNLHIGSGHGCEVADYTIFLADGKPFTPSNQEVIECSTFRAIWKSKCYAADNTFATGNSNNYPKIVNGNKVLAAEHYLNAEFKADNIIDWSNKLVVRRDGTVFNALYGGMVQGYSPYFSDVIVNDANASWESWTSDGTISHKHGSGIYDKKIKGDEVTMWGNGYVIKQKMIQEQVNLNGHSYLYTFKYLTPIRTKVYMIPAKVSLLDSVGSADIFNDGDEINIRLVRKIEIVE